MVRAPVLAALTGALVLAGCGVGGDDPTAGIDFEDVTPDREVVTGANPSALGARGWQVAREAEAATALHQDLFEGTGEGSLSRNLDPGDALLVFVAVEAGAAPEVSVERADSPAGGYQYRIERPSPAREADVVVLHLDDPSSSVSVSNR